MWQLYAVEIDSQIVISKVRNLLVDVSNAVKIKKKQQKQKKRQAVPLQVVKILILCILFKPLKNIGRFRIRPPRTVTLGAITNRLTG